MIENYIVLYKLIWNKYVQTNQNDCFAFFLDFLGH